jgi:hypothetical protein
MSFMNDKKLKQALAGYLAQGHAHAPLSAIVAGFPAALMNRKLAGLPYTAWQVLEHIRIAQKDMADFSRNPDYQELEWPKDYWPNTKATPAAWARSFRDYEKDLREMIAFVKSPKTDLFAPIPWGTGQTVFKEVLQIVDHAAYHAGELVLIRRLAKSWKGR